MAGHGPMPAIRTRPTAINARIATTLTSANQYSTSPKRLTRALLIATSPTDAPATQSHRGAAGNQNPQ